MSDLNIEQLNPFEVQLKELVSATQGNTFAGAIAGDKPTLEAVKKNRIQLRDVRVAITKKGKELREDATSFSKRVIEREKELIAMISPEEERLQKIEDEAKALELKRQREAQFPARARRLEDLNKMPHAEIIDIENMKQGILDLDDVQFESFYNKCFANNNERARRHIEQEEQRKREEEEAKRKAFIKARVDTLTGLGLVYNFTSDAFIAEGIYVPLLDVNVYEEPQWAELIAGIENTIRTKKAETQEVPKEEIVGALEVGENVSVTPTEEPKAVVTPSQEKLDEGHIQLCKDIGAVYTDAMNWEFNDFKNRKYDLPKVQLVSMLQEIIDKTKNGHYDN